MWVSNLLLQEDAAGRIQTAGEGLLAALARTATPTILISNEVGWGIVPDNPLARKFRDQAGWLHQRLAQVADLVVLVVAGVPMVTLRKASRLSSWRTRATAWHHEMSLLQADC